MSKTEMKIVRVKSLINTATFSVGDIFFVETESANGTVYVLDKLNWIRQLKNNEYTIVETKTYEK